MLENLIDRLCDWLMSLIPSRCYLCQRWISSENACPHRLTTGAVVTLCDECRNSMFTPWS